MAFCPNCGTDMGNSRFCPNCGVEVGAGAGATQHSPYQQPVRRTSSGVKYDEGICFLICCFLSPVAALIYYLLTNRDEEYYDEPQY